MIQVQKSGFSSYEINIKQNTKRHPRGKKSYCAKALQIKALPWYITILKLYWNIPNKSFT